MHRRLISNQNTNFQLCKTLQAFSYSPPKEHKAERKDADMCASSGLE